TACGGEVEKHAETFVKSTSQSFCCAKCQLPLSKGSQAPLLTLPFKFQFVGTGLTDGPPMALPLAIGRRRPLLEGFHKLFTYSSENIKNNFVKYSQRLRKDEMK
ncbi:MAG: hypothetical protein IJD81_03590, partial [Oscillospiraceae bacterium]|nr:hypothetical protein [Oscillospiraceae bacterium]